MWLSTDYPHYIPTSPYNRSSTPYLNLHSLKPDSVCSNNSVSHLRLQYPYNEQAQIFDSMQAIQLMNYAHWRCTLIRLAALLHLPTNVTTYIQNGPKSMELFSSSAMQQHHTSGFILSSRNIYSWSMIPHPQPLFLGEPMTNLEHYNTNLGSSLQI